MSNADPSTSDHLKTLGTREDPLYDQAVTLLNGKGYVRTADVQRHLRIGYNRAAALIASMEGTEVSAPDERGQRTLLHPATQDSKRTRPRP
jgi:putative DNA primase/helicase